MPTVKLIPSSYYVSSTHLVVANETNMYANTSSTSYGIITNNEASTSYYYFYLRGFNVSDIPTTAQVSEFTVRIKGRASGAYNASMYLCHGTTTISGATASQLPNSSTVATRTFANGALTWPDVAGYGSGFGIRINCRRNAKNTLAFWRVYGAEIEVTYTIPTTTMWFKQNGAYIAGTKTYKKTSGVWVEQSDLTQVFDPNTNYVFE